MERGYSGRAAAVSSMSKIRPHPLCSRQPEGHPIDTRGGVRAKTLAYLLDRIDLECHRPGHAR
jgi:hypothetical protein